MAYGSNKKKQNKKKRNICISRTKLLQKTRKKRNSNYVTSSYSSPSFIKPAAAYSHCNSKIASIEICIFFYIVFFIYFVDFLVQFPKLNVTTLNSIQNSEY